MGETTTYRAGSSRRLAVVSTTLCLGLVLWLAATAQPLDSLRHGAPVALLALLVWLAFWRPHVEVSDGGVEVRNVWWTVHVPWPALRDVDSRLGLRLVTVYGSYQAWSVPAPRRTRTGAARVPTDAAAAVLERWEELRRAGHLDDARLESCRARTRIHAGAIAATGTLALLSLALRVAL